MGTVDGCGRTSVKIRIFSRIRAVVFAKEELQFAAWRYAQEARGNRLRYLFTKFYSPLPVNGLSASRDTDPPPPYALRVPRNIKRAARSE